MNYKYKIYVDRAYELAKHACDEYQDNNSAFYMAALVAGIGNSYVGSKDNHNYDAVLDGIYKLYSDNPKTNVGKILVEGIKLSGTALLEIKDIKNTINLIIEQYRRQKEQKSPFEIDCNSLLNIINDSIQSDIELQCNMVKEYKWLLKENVN